jgi:hypothetical protein
MRMKSFLILALATVTFLPAWAADQFEIPFYFPKNWSGARDSRKAEILYEYGVELVMQKKLLSGMKVLGESVDADPFDTRALAFLSDIAIQIHYSGNDRVFEELSSFHKEMLRRIIEIRRKYPDNADFEFEYVNMAVGGTNHYNYFRVRNPRDRQPLIDFLKKYPEHKRGLELLGFIYYDQKHLNGIANYELSRKIIHPLLWKDHSWSGGWRALGSSYSFRVHKNYENTRLSQNCLKLAVLLGDEFDEMRFGDGAATGLDPELKLNILRSNYGKSWLDVCNLTYMYKINEAYQYFKSKDLPFAETGTLVQEAESHILSGLHVDLLQEHIMYIIWTGEGDWRNYNRKKFEGAKRERMSR